MTTVAHISDLHVGKTSQEWRVFERWLELLGGEPFDVLVISGDLVHVPDDDVALRRVGDRLDAFGRPYVVVPGNHDVLVPGQNEVFERHFGTFPRVERHAGTDFALFDSHGGLPVADRSPIDRALFSRLGHYSDGRIDREQFDLLATQIGSAEHRVAVVHHFLYHEPNRYDLQPLQNTDDLLEWCVGHEVGHLFVGHLHTPTEPRTERGVTRHRVGRSTKPPFAGALVDLGSGDVRQLRLTGAEPGPP